MKVGDYVRTDKGEIGKVISIANDNDFGLGEEYRGFVAFNTEPYVYGDVIKSNPNIKYLIGFGDYVNGLKVDEIDEKGIYNYNSYDGWKVNIASCNEDIKSIVTKEAFESMEYKVYKND